MLRRADRYRSTNRALWAVLWLVSGTGGLASCTADSTPATVAGWNIEGVGAPGSDEFEAAVDVIEAIEPDIVAVAEIRSRADEAHFAALADRLDFAHVDYTDGAPFGSLRTGVMSRWPFVWRVYDAATLADELDLPEDVRANDLSRFVAVAEVAVPGALPLFVLPVHFKSGTSNNDQLRRAVESWRTRQVLGDGLYIVVGDFNDQINDVPHMPRLFRDVPLPENLPVQWRLGGDLALRLIDFGLLNDPFAPLLDPDGPGLVLLDATRQDGDRGTRPSSGRRLDYALVSPALSFDARAWLYASDDADRFRDADPAPVNASELASDHLPVVVEVEVPPLCIFDRECDDDLWCTGAERCDFGRCVRGQPPCDGVCDEDRQRCG